MKLTIKIATIALSIMSFSFIMSMDKTMYYEQPRAQKYTYILKRTPETEAQRLAAFARAEYITETDITSPVNVAKWLVRQREEDTLKKKEWTIFTNYFIKQMEQYYCPCPCVANKKLSAIIEAVNNTMCTAEPEKDFSELLVDHMREAMLKAVQDFNKTGY